MNWDLERFTVFTGRATRSEFWHFMLSNFIAIVILGAIVDELIGIFYSLGVFIPSIAVGTRRMHDVGKSGWYLLIPFYNLYLTITEGQTGPNDYGPDPKNPDKDDIASHLVE